MWWVASAAGVGAVAFVLFSVLASHVLSFGPAAAGAATDKGRVPDEVIRPGALLATVYEGIPVPPDARLLGWDVSEGRPLATHADLVAPDGAADVLAFYRRALVANGWHEALRETLEAPGGQPSAEPSHYAVFCRGAAGPWVLVVAAPNDSGSTFVRVHIGTEGIAVCTSPARPTPSVDRRQTSSAIHP